MNVRGIAGKTCRDGKLARLALAVTMNKMSIRKCSLAARPICQLVLEEVASAALRVTPLRAGLA